MAMSSKPILKASNVQIANVIRNNATPDYQRHVPVATQANLVDTFAAINSRRETRNLFESMFVNKFAYQEVRGASFENPLAKFKRAQLTYGTTIEEIQVGLLHAYAHDESADYGEEALFSRETPRVDVNYHTVNRYDTYAVTIPTQALRGAFLTEGGLASFASELMSAANTSDARDEYYLMRELFALYHRADGFFQVEVPDLHTIESTPDEARRALRQLRSTAGKLQFLSDKYNAAHMETAIRPDDLELFVTPEFVAATDVDALAAMFNMERGEFAARSTMVDEFPDMPGTQAVLSSPDFFVVADQIYETASQPNAATLSTKHFLHHSQVISSSRFVPAIEFTSKPRRQEITMQNVDTASVTALTVTDASGTDTTEVQRGYSYVVDGGGLNEDGTVDTATVLSIEGALSQLTYITQVGHLHIGPDEAADTLTIRQTATDNGIESTLALTVTGDRVIMWPNAQVLSDSDKDGLDEVEPVAPERDGDTVTIPTVRGVQYQYGDGTTQTNVANGVEVDVPTTITAIARSGFELTGTDVGPWVFTA